VSDGPEWFVPKRYGYGAGMPISWQGWAVTLGFIGLIIAAALYVRPYSGIAFISTAVTLTIILWVIVAKTTRGGWRWRWGDKD
jgi:hypothetical protein